MLGCEDAREKLVEKSGAEVRGARSRVLEGGGGSREKQDRGQSKGSKDISV